ELTAILESHEAQRLATGFVFTEGPLWHPDGFYYFVDVRSSVLYRIVPGRAAEVVRDKTGGGNGTTFDLERRLILCEGDNRRVTRTASDGRIEVLMDRYEGKRLNRPNDVVCKSDGSIYFTDPGLRVPLAERELPYAGVYRVMPDGSTSLVADFEYPNGLAFSADERRQHALGPVHPCAGTRRGRPDGPAADLRRHVLRRDGWRTRRHEGGHGGTCLLHRARRHLGVLSRGQAAWHHPHSRGPCQHRLRRAGPQDALPHRTHLRVHPSNQGARASPSRFPIEVTWPG